MRPKTAPSRRTTAAHKGSNPTHGSAHFDFDDPADPRRWRFTKMTYAVYHIPQHETKGADEMTKVSSIITPEPEFLMPITHIYDPMPDGKQTNHNTIISPLSDVLNPGISRSNSILLTASEAFPWPSQTPGCRQSKHWKTSEKMTIELLQAISEAQSQHGKQAKLPSELGGTDEVKKFKERELLATALKSTTYMFPDASAVRAGMIAQSMLLIFLHDDVVEHFPMDAGSTITDSILGSWKEKEALPDSRKRLHAFIAAIIDEDRVLGTALLEGVFAWVQHTKGYRSIRPDEWSLREYLDYRAIDIGKDLLLAQTSFAADVHLSEIERVPFDTVIGLYLDHVSLTNDLYSFEKEYADHLRTGALLVNAVEVVRNTQNTSMVAAKQITRDAALDVERLFFAECDRLKARTDLVGSQHRFVEALTLCLVGHMFFSVTSGRYGDY